MALGFIDSGFVRLPVMGFVAELVDFVLGCGFCTVGLGGLRGGSWWVSEGGFWLAVGWGGLQGVSWWVCRVARDCGRGCLVDLVAVTVICS